MKRTAPGPLFRWAASSAGDSSRFTSQHEVIYMIYKHITFSFIVASRLVD
jgi:hypothetical protein